MKALESLSIIAVALLGCGADGSGADQDSTVDPRPDTSVARAAGPQGFRTWAYRYRP